jgi:type IV pilus assembly protein PilW
MAANNDAVTVRFANPSARTETGVAMPAADSGLPKPKDAQWDVGDVLIISDCDGADVFEVSSVTNDSIVPNKLSRPYNSGSELTSLWAARYFVAPSTTNGLPTLKRQILQGGGSMTTEELAQGIENLQFLFGEDQDKDGLPDAYRQAYQVANWSHIVSIQVGLLLRSLEEFGTERDTTVHQVLDHAFDDPDDLRLRRRVVQYTVAVRNTMP